jgi:hypothetical protein
MTATKKTRLSIGALLLAAMPLLGACQLSIPWIQGTTFGTDVSISGAHIDTVIYRAPRKALYDYGCPRGACNESAIRDAIWNAGAPPTFSACLLGICYTNTTIRDHMYYWIYTSDNLGPNWSQVVTAAQQFTNCPMIRWIPTVESVRGITSGEGCRIGSLG